MIALIDPRFGRVCEVAKSKFPVAKPLFWTPCQDDCIPDLDIWDAATKSVIYLPRPEPEPAVDLVGAIVEQF